MSASDLAYDRYTTNGVTEWRMRIGSVSAPLLLVLPPLFEELNRTRALIAGTMRALASHGWASVLPDLPGTGESEQPLEACSWDDWRAAVRDAAPENVAGIVSIRGGCLLDDCVAAPAWRLSPVDGVALLRDLERAGRVSNGGTAGYTPSRALAGPMSKAIPARLPQARTVRLASDRGEAARKLDFAPLWRRAEPQNPTELSIIIASDVNEWFRECAAY